jgi:hypothetical protein
MVQTANQCLRGVALLGLLLFASLSIEAQTSSPTGTPMTPKTQAAMGARTVRIEEPGDGAHHYMLPPINLDVIKAFADRIAASDRYTLTKEPADLEVFIICVDSGKEAVVEGDFCTYTFVFRSKKAPEFNMPLGRPNPVFGFRASEIAQNIFEAFVTETTETKLSVAELEAMFRVAEFCAKPANQVPCSGKFQ